LFISFPVSLSIISRFIVLTFKNELYHKTSSSIIQHHPTPFHIISHHFTSSTALRLLAQDDAH
jgi:hypothetical protein